jgi:hypothetical protein
MIIAASPIRAFPATPAAARVIVTAANRIPTFAAHSTPISLRAPVLARRALKREQLAPLASHSIARRKLVGGRTFRRLYCVSSKSRN